MIRFKPLGPRILVEPIDPETDVDQHRRNWGLVVPDQYAERYEPKPTTGIVVEISDDPTTSHLFAVGDVVMYGLRNGLDIQIQGKRYVCLEDREVLGKLTDEKEEACTIN